jgi:hypothetical protein
MLYPDQLFSTKKTARIIDILGFINKLTKNKLHAIQLNRAIAYLRAKRLVFYDDWSKDHVALLGEMELPQAKELVLNAIRIAANYTGK